MSYFLNLVTSGLVIGALYGLVAMGFAFQAEGTLFPLVMALFGLALTLFGYGTNRFYGRRAALEAAAAKGRPIHRKRSLAR